jgi:glycosyltransferase involved in cell wall biosynthesis
MVGEHFGIAVIEAMAAGLITVVPNEGGPSEFVPQKYHYNTIEQAAEIITHIFNQLPKAERVKISNDTNKFSTCRYIEGFKTILNEMLSKRRK